MVGRLAALMPPAARITDLHTCPAHAGGPLITGFPTVLIGYQPAARVSDVAVCGGPSDAVTAGSANVLIGHRQAARMGDPTSHGGVVATGFPTVLIGTTAQAATLAGAGGAPFCEECERARREAAARAREAEAEPPGAEPASAEAAQEESPAGAETPTSADTPTESEVAQASAPGDTLAQRVAREKVVREFYAKSGLGSARADMDLGVGGRPPRANQHPRGFGIDLTKPVRVVPLPETLAQEVAPGEAPSGVFDPRGTPLGEALGLGALPRREGLTTFALPAGEGLLSTSGSGAGRTPGLPQLTVSETLRRLAQPGR